MQNVPLYISNSNSLNKHEQSTGEKQHNPNPKQKLGQKENFLWQTYQQNRRT